MPDSAKFLEAIKAGYSFKGEAFKIGDGILDDPYCGQYYCKKFAGGAGAWRQKQEKKSVLIYGNYLFLHL